MKHLILPTDFSDNSRHASKYALNLLNEEGAKHILINSYESPRPTGMLINIDDILKKDSINALFNEKGLLMESFPEFKGEILTIDKMGYLQDVLQQVINTEKGDLIVMGTQGATGLKEIFIGSNASDVIQNSSTPVLAVPANAPLTSPKTIVLAADYESLKDVSVLSMLREIAIKNNSTILIVNVKNNSEGELEFNSSTEKLAIEEYFESVNHEYHEIKHDNVAEGLNEFLAKHKADMLAMIPERLNFLSNLFHKSVTKQMVLHTKIPLLSLR